MSGIKTDTNVLEVSKWELKSVKELRQNDEPFYVRTIVITTESGGEVHITMFADEAEKLFLYA